MQYSSSNNNNQRRNRGGLPRTPRLDPLVRRQVNAIVDSKLSADVEYKYVDQILDISPTYATAYPLTGVPQGSAQSNRVGNQITPKKVMLNWAFAAGDTTNIVRAYVVQYYAQIDSATFSATTFLAQPIANGVLSMPNIPNASDYKVLWDSGIRDLSANGPASVSGRLVLDKKMRNVVYGSNGTATVATGHIFFVALNDSGAAPSPNIRTVSRLLFEDA